ncbi:regulator of G protein signaling domain-containing protein [Dactylonectria estremocensis]|uniref:Regulator of G protein signaling domain-containing protein n=1 Tax=Dactylonectria estremocensis TaxID=1079267 RepID=A0A9P9IEI7_9HYPO|nr:regulator of G protein signaling domain-containing protein [Dactylonectria estremocensis]
MNQTTSRTLRLTDNDRPYSKDLKDIFSTLIASLMPLSAHRVRFTKVDYAFLSEDAIHNLGSLKFSQSNTMPDYEEPTRIITTTSTTTFSMSKEMGASLCQRFLDARFIESADGKHDQIFTMKGSVWQLTPKGITVLDRFCARNGVQQNQIVDLTNLFSTQLITLERDPMTDMIFLDQGTIEVIFCRFGGSGMLRKSSSTPSLGLSPYDQKGAIGVKMSGKRKVNGQLWHDAFTGKAGSDWLMDYATIIDQREAVEIASLFIKYNLMEQVTGDRAYVSQHPTCDVFQPTKTAMYALTQHGKNILSSNTLSRGTSRDGSDETPQRHHNTRDSNTQRLDKILSDPTLRLLFRENLQETHCEENLAFYQEVDEYIRLCKAAIRALEEDMTDDSANKAKELLAQSYGMYNAFLAPGSPRELNIDHQLRRSLVGRMTKAVAQDVIIAETLQAVTVLLEDAQQAVFKLVASDSVPKFFHNVKYEYQLSQAGVY